MHAEPFIFMEDNSCMWVQVRLEQIFQWKILETSVNFSHPFISFTDLGIDSAYPE